MRAGMRGAVLFLSGLIVGGGLVATAAAQGTFNTGMRLNHVGISVPNFQETVNFYEKVMGFRVSHRFAPNADGRPGTAFVQIIRDTSLRSRPACLTRSRQIRTSASAWKHRHVGSAPEAERRGATEPRKSETAAPSWRHHRPAVIRRN